MEGFTPAELDLPHEAALAEDAEQATRQRGAAPGERREKRLQDVERLVAVLRANPGLELPYEFGCQFTFMFFGGDDPRTDMAAAARAIPVAGNWGKHYSDATDRYPAYFDMNGEMAGGLRIKLTALRDQVCERIVTGTEMRPVERVITPAVTETVDEPVEIVEWRCAEPVMAPAGTDAAEAETDVAA
jgi:hypothetical protein